MSYESREIDMNISNRENQTKQTNLAYFITKRIIDVFLSSLGLCILFPLALIIAFAIKLDDPKGPVIFSQERSGKNKIPFTIFKFRTMKTEAPKDCASRILAGNQDYVTRLGKFLRKTSLDEIPQLINILRGDMSIIGPRPVVLTETEQIADRDLYQANDIKPGLTGLAQVNGRDLLDTKEKAYYDGLYVKNASLFLDAVIFIKTIIIVVSARGVEPIVCNIDAKEIPSPNERNPESD